MTRTGIAFVLLALLGCGPKAEPVTVQEKKAINPIPAEFQRRKVVHQSPVPPYEGPVRSVEKPIVSFVGLVIDDQGLVKEIIPYWGNEDTLQHTAQIARGLRFEPGMPTTRSSPRAFWVRYYRGGGATFIEVILGDRPPS
jgi:hypothetical protein